MNNKQAIYCIFYSKTKFLLTMKKLSKIKLNQLANVDLNLHEMDILRGGGTHRNCCCGCNGPYSSSDNSSANNARGLSSPAYTTFSPWMKALFNDSCTLAGCP